MADAMDVAGVVLAGGQSSRMGRDKALLPFRGRPLVDHMAEILRRSGVADIYISGRDGGGNTSAYYRYLPDSSPFAGPAAAIRDILDRLSGSYSGILFTPVDTPFLTAEILRALLDHEDGACYACGPLPLYLPASGKVGGDASVRGMIAGMGISVLPVPPESQICFANLNTPQEWEEAFADEC